MVNDFNPNKEMKNIFTKVDKRRTQLSEAPPVDFDPN